MVAKISVGNSLYGALAYNGMKSEWQNDVAVLKAWVAKASKK